MNLRDKRNARQQADAMPRAKLAVRLRKRGMKLAEIGTILHISRQRVYQLIRRVQPVKRGKSQG